MSIDKPDYKDFNPRELIDFFMDKLVQIYNENVESMSRTEIFLEYKLQNDYGRIEFLIDADKVSQLNEIIDKLIDMYDTIDIPDTTISNYSLNDFWMLFNAINIPFNYLSYTQSRQYHYGYTNNTYIINLLFRLEFASIELTVYLSRDFIDSLQDSFINTGLLNGLFSRLEMDISRFLKESVLDIINRLK